MTQPRPTLIHRVIARLNIGGPAMHVVNLTRALNEGPWRTRLIAGRVEPTEGDMSYYAAERGVSVDLISSMSRSLNPVADLKSFLALYRRFRRERPDIVHTHTAKAGTVGRLAAVLAGVPVRVHTYHGHVLGGVYFGRWMTGMFRFIERMLGRWTHRLVVLTHRQARQMSDELRIAPSAKFVVIPLGLELDRFLAVDPEVRRAEVRRELELREDALVVGIVGRLVPVKNHELFLEALAALRSSGQDDVWGVVVGSGEREAELRARAARLRIADRVRWLGWRSDLPDLYAAMDVMALTSHDEGTPVALIEALAAGARVVARDVGGVRELLAGVRGALVVPREAGPDAWSAELERAIARPRPTRAEREAVARRFSVERLAADMAGLYEELLHAGGSAA